jgi:hypothetical protein
MPRARNIKPSFFRNPDLAEIAPVERLLFIGLWTMADREGRLEDRPRYIKFELLPSDTFDIDDALNSLQDRGFIIRYEHGASRFIQVINFVKHQNPHVKEAPSTIPAPVKYDASTGQAGLNPESPLLIPETGNLKTDDDGTANADAATDDDEKDKQDDAEKNKRGTRFSPDATLTQEFIDVGTALNFPEDRIAWEFDEFKDYWIGVPGSKGVKLDWVATFRNHLRRHIEQRGGLTPIRKLEPGQKSPDDWSHRKAVLA